MIETIAEWFKRPRAERVAIRAREMRVETGDPAANIAPFLAQAEAEDARIVAKRRYALNQC